MCHKHIRGSGGGNSPEHIGWCWGRNMSCAALGYFQDSLHTQWIQVSMTAERDSLYLHSKLVSVRATYKFSFFFLINLVALCSISWWLCRLQLIEKAIKLIMFTLPCAGWTWCCSSGSLFHSQELFTYCNWRWEIFSPSRATSVL